MLLVFIVYHFDCLALFVILIFVHRIEDSQDDVPKKLPSLVHFFPTSTDSDSTTLACSRSFSDEIPLSYCLSSPQVSGATISTIGPKPLKPALVTHSHSENSLGKQNTNFFRVFLKHIVWVIICLEVRMMFYYLSSVSIGSVQLISCVWLCDTMECSTPGLPVYHQLPEFTQTHVHQGSDAIHPSHPLLSSSPPALNLSQHQGLFQWVNSLHQVAKGLEFQL